MGDSNNIDGQKIDLHLDRVVDWIYRGDTTPIYVEVSPTARCNHRCTFCALDYAQSASQIPQYKLKEMGDQMFKLGVRGVMFGGEGEPTLHESLADVIAHYNILGLDTALTTNGTRLGERFAEEGGEWLKWVKVSLNAGDSETYARIHRTAPSHYFDVWGNILEFRDSCQHHHPTIGVQAVAVPDNLESLPHLCYKAVQNELDYVVIKPFSPNAYSGNNDNIAAIPTAEWNAVAARCRSLATPRTSIIIRDRQVAKLNSTAQSNTKESYARCCAVPYFWFYINSKMDLIACSNWMLDERFRLGNFSTSTLQDMWYSYSQDKREKLKELMRTFDISQCRKACRMDRVNEWLWRVSQPHPHKSFI